jgi:hypothetical protein
MRNPKSTGIFYQFYAAKTTAPHKLRMLGMEQEVPGSKTIREL